MHIFGYFYNVALPQWKLPISVKKIHHPFVRIIAFLVVLVYYWSGSEGAKRWLNFYCLNSPIEILVMNIIILVTVKILTFDKLKNSQLKYFLLAIVLLSIDQPDLGQSILLIGS